MKRPVPKPDPMEAIITRALTNAGISFVTERDSRAMGLDFFLPDHNVHIEVKQFHSARISGQMAKAENVIAIQGLAAAIFFEAVILSQASCAIDPNRSH